ncbi:MAG: hypothetical protein RL095_1439 [Verrucomicrobiota bacterium]|jgi:two-component system phosphate regulon response regulator PhoB
MSLILVVDDEEDVRNLLRYVLEKEGFQVETAASGPEGLDKALRLSPDLMVLDGMLPGLDGNDVVMRLRQQAAGRSLPVLMLSARSDESDQLVGMKLGADDYVTKPFSPKLLAAKIAAMLRRQQPADADADAGILRHRGLEMNPDDHSASINGQPLKLTAVEYKLLLTLLRKPGRVFTRERILEAVRGDDVILTSRTVDVHILALRRKLGPAGELIETIRGVGYKFQA